MVQKIWSFKEEAQLIEHYKTEKDLEVLAIRFNKTDFAIRSKLVQLKVYDKQVKIKPASVKEIVRDMEKTLGGKNLDLRFCRKQNIVCLLRWLESYYNLPATDYETCTIEQQLIKINKICKTNIELDKTPNKEAWEIIKNYFDTLLNKN